MLDPNDTIAALASPPGGAARGIVRVSGPDAVMCVARCFVPDDRRLLTSVRLPTGIPGNVSIRSLTAPLPCVLYLWPSSKSYTRQPTVELHTLGSPPLLDALLGEVCAQGARLARPGEFTLRAFLAGRLDLTQAEAVLGVIEARDSDELNTALAQLAGGIAAPLARLRGRLLELLAQLEAGLDFVEEDIEFISPDELLCQLNAVQCEADALAEQVQTRDEGATIFRAVLTGAPNAGKSSLFNALTGQRALVCDKAGTTRDFLTARLELDGVICELVDTAGISNSATDRLALAAHEESRRQQRQADVEILCVDSSREMAAEEKAMVQSAPAGERVIVLTKVDRRRGAPDFPDAVNTSSHTGAGLDDLRMRLKGTLRRRSPPGRVVAATAVRCRESLRFAADALARARQIAEARAGEELVASELRSTLNHLGEVAGAVYTDDVLDRIFSRFCIGK